MIGVDRRPGVVAEAEEVLARADRPFDPICVLFWAVIAPVCAGAEMWGALVMSARAWRWL